MQLEVLVATRNQPDLSLSGKMNLSCPVVVANQAGYWGYEARGATRMLTTDTVGVGINRNLALDMARGEILLLADDDMTYYDPRLQGVLDAFDQLPQADVICFGVDGTKNGEIVQTYREPIRRRHIWNSMRFGACRMAIRRAALEKARLRFSTEFGGGARYGSGEDTLFLRDCLKAGLQVWSHSYVLGRSAMDTSSWFTGYDEKYFFDRGALMAAMFPVGKQAVKYHTLKKFTPKSKMTLLQARKWMVRGMVSYKNLTTFDQYGKKVRR